MAWFNKERRDFARGLAIAVAVGVFLALSRAFVGESLSLTQRLVYWLPLMVVGAVWGHLCAALVRRYIDMDEKPWLTVVALSLVAALPFSLLVWAWTGPAFGEPVFPLWVLPKFIVPVLTITVALTLINVFVSRAPPETHAAPAGAAPARFLERLPFKLKGATIHAVESEDHYLRVHTDRGSDLVLMRLSDAVAELEGLEGAQVHRSWWVAKEAVLGAKRGDGRATLTIKGGVEAPVSRRYAPALRKAGWY